MSTAAIYARYSSDNQRDESIDAQVRAIREYCQDKDIQIVRIYTDEARSATTDNRPGFLQMVHDSALGQFELVIVHKLDRFSRDRYDFAFYKRELKKNGVQLVSVLENLDDSPESIILESVLQGMAEYYSVNLAREAMKGMRETALQCKHTGGKPPLGYQVTKEKTYAINEDQAEAVRLIFNMYSNGHGYGRIIDELNSRGHRTQNGNHFGKNSIHEILRNEKYRGVYIFNRSASKSDNGKRNHHASKPQEEMIRIEGGMPRIVDDVTWERVQKRMAGNKRGAASAKETYLLAGLVFCGKCGSAMTGHRRPGGTKGLYISYECSTRKRTKQCDMKSVAKHVVEGVVIKYLEAQLFSPAGVDLVTEKIIAYASQQNQSATKEIRALEAQLQGVRTEINNLVDAIAQGMFHQSMKSRMDHLEARQADLLIRIQDAKQRSGSLNLSVAQVKNYLAQYADIKTKSPETQKRIIQAYVKKVVVYDDDTIDIVLSVTFDGGGGAYREKVTIPLVRFPRGAPCHFLPNKL